MGAEEELHQYDDVSDTESVPELDERPKRTFPVIMTEVSRHWKTVASNTAVYAPFFFGAVTLDLNFSLADSGTKSTSLKEHHTT